MRTSTRTLVSTVRAVINLPSKVINKLIYLSVSGIGKIADIFLKVLLLFLQKSQNINEKMKSSSDSLMQSEGQGIVACRTPKSYPLSPVKNTVA
jgi:hypothetical protein